MGAKKEEMTTATRQRPTPSRNKKIVRSLLIFIMAWFLVQAVYVTADGLHAFRGKADVAIVLGNRVNEDSSLSPVLQGRVDRALSLYREGRVQRIMVSGGKGEGEKGLHVWEGAGMKRYLLAKGVPADLIIEDNDGENTWCTGKDFIRANDSLHFASAVVVSSFYHITRSKYIIRKLGYKNVSGACSESFFWNDFIGLPRDMLAFYKYMLVY